MLAALLALMVQLAVGATVPQPDPVSDLLSAETLCHIDRPANGPDRKVPPLECLACPFCLALHATAVMLPGAPVLRPPGSQIVRQSAPLFPLSPLLSTPHRPGQPRGPPSA